MVPRRSGLDAIDGLMERASTILANWRLPVAEPDDEVAMDFLAERDDFMSLLEEKAAGMLDRASRGVGDPEFEAAMVALMGAVQSRLGWFFSRRAVSVPAPPKSATT